MERVGFLIVATTLWLTASAAVAFPIGPSPFVRTTRATAAGAVPVTGDFDGDGYTDIFWYRPGTGADYIWFGSASATALGQSPVEFVVNGRYRPVAGDFNGDGRGDIAWLSTRSDVPSYTWFGKADRTFTSENINSQLAEAPVGSTVFAGDFDGGGTDDLFVYSPNGQHVIYKGATSLANVFASTMAVPLIAGTYTPLAADFNGDGRADIMWLAPTGTNYYWESHSYAPWVRWPMDPTVPVTSFAGNFSGDAAPDLFEYGSGRFLDRIEQGGARGLTGNIVPVPDITGTYTPVVGDFDGNGKADIIWYTNTSAPSPYWVAR